MGVQSHLHEAAALIIANELIALWRATPRTSEQSDVREFWAVLVCAFSRGYCGEYCNEDKEVGTEVKSPSHSSIGDRQIFCI